MLRWKSSLKPATAAANYSSIVLADSPVAYWQLDESSGTTLADSVGSYDLTLTGSYSLNQSSLAGSSASVDFTGGHAAGANQGPNLSSTDYTMELVTKLDSTQPSWSGLISSGDHGNNWSVQRYSSTGDLRVYHGTSQVTFTGDFSSIADDSSHHLVVTYINSSKKMELWIDGVSQGTLTHTGNPNNNTGYTLRLASERTGIGASGFFDEAAIYTSKLSDATIAAHYNAATAATGITLEDSAVTTGLSFSSPLNIDVNIPAVSANDILFLFCTTNDYSEPTDSPPAGWTKIAEQDGQSSSTSTVAAYWKRASSSAAATTETWSAFYPNGEAYYIWVGAYSGCVTSGSPVDAYGSSASGFSATWSVNVTTTTADTMIATICGNTNGNITHTWSDGTELIDTPYYSGNAAVSINEKLEATAGSKTRTVTPSVSGANAMIAVALKDAVSGGGGGTSPGTTNLLAWYEMNDASGGAVDSHSGSYDLTENGTPLYAQTGVNGNAIDFDGSTDYFSLASTFGWSEAYPFSFSAHFKTSSASTQTISQMTAPGATGKYVLMSVQADGEVSAYVRDGTIQSIVSSGAGVGDGAWHHLVATFVSATERYLYLDGVQVAGSASETSQGINTAMSEIRVGADQSNGISSYFDGLLDDVAFWSDELTLNEITWLYNSGSGRSYSAL